MQSGNTYRFKPDGSHVEYFTHGQVNPFGLCLRPARQPLLADCHSRPIYQLLRGGLLPQLRQAARRPRLRPGDDDPRPRLDRHRRHRLLRGRPFPGRVPRHAVHRQRGDQPRSTTTGSSGTARRPRRIEQPDFLTATTPGSARSTSSSAPTARCTSPTSTTGSSATTRCRSTHPGRDRERGRIWRIVYRGTDGKADAAGPAPTGRKATRRGAGRRPRPPQPGRPHPGRRTSSSTARTEGRRTRACAEGARSRTRRQPPAEGARPLGPGAPGRARRRDPRERRPR